jgi:PAS domain S-box-containing protein
VPDNQKTNTLRVLIADDAPAVRTAITELLIAESGLELAGAAVSAGEAIALAELASPDVALLDVRMPGGGVAAARGIGKVSPETRVIALSAYDDAAVAAEMLAAGAVGYLVKGEPVEEIIEAIKRAGRGRSSLSAELTKGVFEELARSESRHRETEQTLRESEKTLLTLLESAPDAIVNLDASGAIVFANRRVETLFGYARDELLGSAAEMLLPARFRDTLHGDEDALGDSAHPPANGTTFELAGLRNDGSEFPLEIAIATIETPAGPILSAAFRDMSATARRLAESAERTSRDRISALLEWAPDALVIVKPDGRIELVNQQTEGVFGYARGELIGVEIETLVPARLRARHAELRSDYARDPCTRPMGGELELTGRRKDGSEFPVDISLASVETDDGPVMMTFIRDITERKRRTQLEQEIAMRRELLSHLVAAGEAERRRIARDIHDDSIQAITAAGIRVQMLRRTLGSGREVTVLDELESTIQFSITRLRHLLFELLPPVLDHDGLSSALRTYLDQMADDSDTIYWLDDKLREQPPTEARLILFRIAQEALTNMRKHSGAATVAVRLIGLDGGFCVRVMDDGIGFECNRLASAPGHLGLAGMRERATLAGGWLRIESRPGAGTSVECWIPAGTAAEATVLADAA